MKYRLVREPFGQGSNYYVEQFREDLGVWSFVSGTLRNNAADGAEVFDKIKRGTPPEGKTILEECEI